MQTAASYRQRLPASLFLPGWPPVSKPDFLGKGQGEIGFLEREIRGLALEKYIIVALNLLTDF